MGERIMNDLLLSVSYTEASSYGQKVIEDVWKIWKRTTDAKNLSDIRFDWERGRITLSVHEYFVRMMRDMPKLLQEDLEGIDMHVKYEFAKKYGVVADIFLEWCRNTIVFPNNRLHRFRLWKNDERPLTISRSFMRKLPLK